jgi:hypothetical protein
MPIRRPAVEIKAHSRLRFQQTELGSITYFGRSFSAAELMQ